ncbi:MAG: AAA family ATPase [Candidatus Lokiarchaeota archaeon]|nr:AAA family ATPase [Candidatus Lokiarchaeota archaeon]
MQINYLKLKNFCNVVNEEIYFDNGLNLLIGDNGSGKSTILDAIQILLFNYAANPLKEYIRWGEKSFYLEMKFNHLGKTFTIEYSYGNSSNRKLMIDGVVWDDNTSACAELEKYFHSKLSMASIVSYQDENTLIDTKPAERREFLKRISDLDFTEEVKKVDEQIKELKDIDLIDLDKKVYAYENKKYKYKEGVNQPFQKEEIEKDKKALDNLEKLKGSMEDILKRYMELKQELSNIADKLNKVNTKKLLEERKKQTSIAALVSEESIISDNFIESLVISKRKELEDEKVLLENQILDYKNKEKGFVLKRLPVFDETVLDTEKQKLFSLRNDISNCRKTLDKISKGVCVECGRPYENAKEQEAEYKLNITRLEELETTAQEKINDLVSQKKLIDDRQKENETALLEKNKLVLRIEKLQNSLLNLAMKKETEINNLIAEDNHKKELAKRTLGALKAAIEESTLAISGIESEIKDLELEKLAKEKTLSDISLPENQEEIDKDIVILKQKIESFHRIELENQMIEKFNEALAKEKEKDKAEWDALLEKKQALVVELDEWEKSKLILQKTFPNYLLRSTLESLEKGMYFFINSVYRKSYRVYFEEKKDAIRILYGDYKRDVKRASGYEKKLFSFAYKDALNRMQGLDFAILDEVDGSASAESSEAFFTFLGEQSKNYSQMIIITHKKEIQELLENDFNAKTFYVKDGVIS